MLGAVAHFLHGKDLSGMGFVPASRALAVMVNLPPKILRQYVYIKGGRREAIPPTLIPQLRAEEISQWVVHQYPKRRVPAVMVGSSNGAMVHLCAALGIPWLPQTVLVPVRRHARISPDDIQADFHAFHRCAARLLDRNPELQVNQMIDPVQDRLMIQQMGYFRIKRLQVGKTYERFLKQVLPPGGTLLVSECTYAWPMTQIGPRHFFQVGGYGGLGPKEYFSGSARVARFLRAQGSERRQWDCPPRTATRPEAEWGFEPALLEDLRRVARRNGWRVRRLVFHDPADLSPLVADFYREGYRRVGIKPTRLFAESFLLLDLWWCLRTGCVPFWMVFNTGSSARELQRYVRRRGPFDEIYLTLFANSVKGIDQPGVKAWKAILRQAREKGALIGVDEESYPYDLGVYFRFHPDLKRTLRSRFPLPQPRMLSQWSRFLARHRNGEVRWLR